MKPPFFRKMCCGTIPEVILARDIRRAIGYYMSILYIFLSVCCIPSRTMIGMIVLTTKDRFAVCSSRREAHVNALDVKVVLKTLIKEQD